MSSGPGTLLIEFSPEPLEFGMIIIPILFMGKQVERGEMTCPRLPN